MGRVRSGPPTSHTIDFPAHIKTNTLFISFSNKKKKLNKTLSMVTTRSVNGACQFYYRKKATKKKHKKNKRFFFFDSLKKSLCISW